MAEIKNVEIKVVYDKILCKLVKILIKMKFFIYKNSLAFLLISLCLSGCCIGTDYQKNSQDIKQEADILQANSNLCNHQRSRVKNKYQTRRRFKKEKNEVKPSFKSYEEHVSEQDKQDISFVVLSVAEKSSIALAMSQQEIKEALLRLNEVHPLALLQAVSEDPSLLVGLRKMQERDWIWELFTTELNKIFSEAASQGVIKDQDVTAFAATLGLDTATVVSAIRGERWSELLNILMSHPF